MLQNWPRFHERAREKRRRYFGGEMSAHHYFKDFFYCDSGMIPWILVIQMMADQDKSLSELVNQYMTAFPASGEINTAVEDPEGVDSKKLNLAIKTPRKP